MATAQIMYFVCRRQTEFGLFRFKAGKIKLGGKKKMKQRRNIWFALQTTDSFHQAIWRYKNGKRK